MDCDENIVKLTYKQLKEMAEGNSGEKAAEGMCKLTVFIYLFSG